MHVIFFWVEPQNILEGLVNSINPGRLVTH